MALGQGRPLPLATSPRQQMRQRVATGMGRRLVAQVGQTTATQLSTPHSCTAAVAASSLFPAAVQMAAAVLATLRPSGTSPGPPQAALPQANLLLQP